jgi:hypothetical protein
MICKIEKAIFADIKESIGFFLHLFKRELLYSYTNVKGKF